MILKQDLIIMIVTINTVFIVDHSITILNVISSPKMLIDGGIGAFIMQMINQFVAILGHGVITPLFMIILRDFVILYN